MIAALQWRNDSATLRALDQTKLPGQVRYLDIGTVDELVTAITSLAVRGAPALGAVGALGVVIAMNQASVAHWSAAELSYQVNRIRQARPTAVNLAWGVDQVWPLADQGVAAVLAAALQIIAEDQAANAELSRLGADWILNQTGLDQLCIITHCNSGALATTGWGTGYGIIHELHQRGAVKLVFADETRPLLQGSRLTSFELDHDRIPYVVQADGAGASTILRGMVDVAIIGADRIAANGDTANKIGSVGLALAAHRAGIPFVVGAPSSTVDLDTATGADIHIEDRDGEEVLDFAGVRVAPPGAVGFNPAFDVTPRDLISAIVTERGVVTPDAISEAFVFAGLV
jgi:methylthioribose-1-phosphate isomerase